MRDFHLTLQNSYFPSDPVIQVYSLKYHIESTKTGWVARYYCFKDTGKIWLEYSEVICHVVLLYSVDWTKACISFIFLTVNLFRNCTLTECEV